MSPGGAAGAAWLLVLIALISRWPKSQLEAGSDRCEDEARQERVERWSPRGRIPLLACPSDLDPGSSDSFAREPTGMGRLILGRTIDLDRASQEELQALPGIGPGLSRRIVEDRSLHGPFGRVEALVRVKGIGAARVEALHGWVHASGGSAEEGEAGKAASQ